MKQAHFRVNRILYNNIMIRTNLESSHQPHPLWFPHPSLPSIFQHKFSGRQLEMHRISTKATEHTRQLSFIEGRITNHHPHICCLYFYQVVPGQGPVQQNFKEILVYADRMIDLQKPDWNQDNILRAVVALKRLIMTYGSFRLSKGCFRKNEINEIKVWISQYAYKNQPDQLLANQQQMVINFLDILNQQNPMIRYSLKGVKTFRQIIQKLNAARTNNKKGHKYTPSIAMNIIEENGNNLQPTQEHFVNKNKVYEPGYVQRAKSSSPDRIHAFKMWNSKQFRPKHQRQSSGQDRMSHRNNAYFNTFYNSSRLQSKRTHAPPSTDNPFRPQFPTTPQPSTSNFNQNPYFSSKRFSREYKQDNDVSYSKLKNMNGITIINNNVNNYYQGMDRPHYSRQISKQKNSQMSHVPCFSSTKQPSSPAKFRQSKQNKMHQKSVPSFISHRKKLFSVHTPNNASYQPSNQVSQNMLNPDNLELPQTAAKTKGRKDNKIFTFCKFQKDPSNKESQQFLTYTPKADTLQVNLEDSFKKNRVQSNYFPSKKMMGISSRKESLGHELDMAESKAVEEDPSITLKKQLAKQCGFLLNFDFTHKHPEQQQVNTENLLKEKIKKKQQAFAELKKEALLVLID